MIRTGLYDNTSYEGRQFSRKAVTIKPPVKIASQPETL